MTEKQLADIIKSFGVAWRYNHFTKTPAPPYVVYSFPNDDDLYADGINYVNKRKLLIELFTLDESETDTIEATLTQNGFAWYKARDFLNDENLYQITYESEVLING